MATEMQSLIPRNQTPNDIWDQIQQLEDEIANIRNSMPGLPGVEPGQLAYWNESGQLATSPGGANEGTSVPLGGIIIWYSTIASIPDGFTLCDGDTVNGFVTPDLRNVAVFGAGDTYNPGDTGGAATYNLQHTHPSGGYSTDNDTHAHANLTAPGTGDFGGGLTFFKETDNDTHSHDVTGSSGNGGSTTQSVLNPYHALAFIMRVS